MLETQLYAGLGERWVPVACADLVRHRGLCCGRRGGGGGCRSGGGGVGGGVGGGCGSDSSG